MFLFKKKFIKEAKEWLRVAHKIRNYRRDILAPELHEEIEKQETQLKKLLKQKPAPNKAVTELTRNLERTLMKTKCPYATRRSLAENVEVIIVAAILAMGARTYILQPFQIPTNSMYPTYSGMNYEIIENPREDPGIRAKLRTTLKRTTGRYHYEAPASGEVKFILFKTGDGNFVNIGQSVEGRKWLFLPSTWSAYNMAVGTTEFSVQVPTDFNFNDLLRDTFGPYDESRLQFVRTVTGRDNKSYEQYVYNTGRVVESGDPLMVFDILPGDMLFVDRISYHFVQPEIGDPFVFKTDKIVTMDPSERGKYYIKRLVGKGGDQLQVEPPVLYRNGDPIDGAGAFQKNNETVGEYEGYNVEEGMRFLNWENAVTIPEKHYFAMGDNSDASSDSRYWGFVPEESVIGQALIIYYPFTSRMGLAK